MKKVIFRFLADLRVTIFTFLLISCFSILGTLIEQDQSVEIYKLNYPITTKLFGVFSWNTILFFGLDHIFKTWWFYSLILLFGTSLILCTILQQLPALKIAQRCQFFRTAKLFKLLEFSTNLQESNFPELLKKSKITHYSFFQQKKNEKRMAKKTPPSNSFWPGHPPLNPTSYPEIPSYNQSIF